MNPQTPRAPLRLVADAPTSDPALGFHVYVDALASSIRGIEPAQATIGLFGSWGSGKSSILEALAQSLRADTDVLPVRFDAWRHDGSQGIVVPLMYAVRSAISESTAFHGVLDRATVALRAVVASLEISAGVATFKGADLASALGESPDPAEIGPDAALSSLAQGLNGKRIAILIDDLDRCSERNVIALLESINTVLDLRGFIFVLALDYEVIVSTLERHYPGLSAHRFLEKLIHVPFRVPAPAVDPKVFLREVVPTWQSFVSTHSSHVVDHFCDIVELSTRANPRQSKRLINAYLLLERVLGPGASEEQLIGLISLLGLQVGWPGAYSRMYEAMVSGNTDPFGSLRDTDDQLLRTMEERYFSNSTDSREVAGLVRLTSVVSNAAVAISEPRAGFNIEQSVETLNP